MRLCTLALVAALAACGLARVHVMKLQHVPMRAQLIKSGKYAEYAAALYKHRLSLPSHLDKAGTGGQPFVDYYDDFYLANCSIGTPPQYSTLVMDTGSSNLWVIDAKCKSQYCKGENGTPKKHQFDSTKSSTYTAETKTFSIQYGSGSCKGHLAKDKFDFGGGLEVTSQEFGLAESIAEVFGYQPVDGICGLGWPALAVDNVEPPINNLLTALTNPGFHVFMSRHTKTVDNGSPDGGQITFGAQDTTNCAKLTDQNFIPLTAETYWQFNLDGYSVGSKSGTTRQTAISDTGTSWIGSTTDALNAVVAATGGTYDNNNQLYYVPCSKMSTLPDFVVTLGGQKYPMKSTEYVLDLGLGGGNCALTFFDMGTIGFGPQWILGDTFIRAYCNYYDVGGKRIGFSKSTQP